MTVKNYQDKKVVTLSKAFDTRAKKLNIAYFIVFSSIAIRLITLLNSTDSYFDSSKLIAFFVLAIIVIAYLFAGYKFLNKSFQTEKIIAGKNILTISKSGFLSKQEKNYDPKQITNFRHLDKPITTTKHPLAGQSFDYLGFQTQQQVINEMHGADKLSFDYDGNIVKFGQNIYSWDYEELLGILNEATDSNLARKDEIENHLDYE